MQYAGNVLVYGAMSPCDGDWFGGVNDSNAADFLSGVLDAEVYGTSTFEAHPAVCCNHQGLRDMHCCKKDAQLVEQHSSASCKFNFQLTDAHFLSDVSPLIR